MTHALTRTSPKGMKFIGRCIKCGQEDLDIGAPLLPCPADALVSDEAALLSLLPYTDAALPKGASHE